MAVYPQRSDGSVHTGHNRNRATDDADRTHYSRTDIDPDATNPLIAYPSAKPT